MKNKVKVLVGATKGGFIFESSAARKKWRVSGIISSGNAPPAQGRTVPLHDLFNVQGSPFDG